MKHEGLEGISEASLAEVDTTSREITGRTSLPFWFNDITVDSRPAQMLLETMEEQRVLTSEYDADGSAETRERLSDANEKYRLMAEFHRGHRKKHEAGMSLLLSMARQYYEIEKEILSGRGGWSWSQTPEKLRPFMDGVIVAYLSFYNTPLRDATSSGILILPPEIFE